MPKYRTLPSLSYVYFIYLMLLPSFALMGLVQTFNQKPTYADDNFSGLLLGMLLGAMGFLTCLLFIHFPTKLYAQLILILDAPLQIALFKWSGSPITWMQYLMIDFVVEAFGYLILLATIPVFYPKLFPNAMEDKPFTRGGIGVSILFGTSLAIIVGLFGSTVFELLKKQPFWKLIPIYTATITTIVMYLKYIKLSPPEEEMERTTMLLIGYGIWLVMSFGLASFLVNSGFSF